MGCAVGGCRSPCRTPGRGCRTLFRTGQHAGVHLPPWALAADPLTVAAVTGALGAALLQLVLARWRDLGPCTIAVAGAVVALVGPTGPVLAAVALGALLAGAAWARGGRHGVGHPGVTGAVFAVAVAVNAGLTALLTAFPGDPRDLRIAGAAIAGSAGFVGLTVALRRRGARHPRVRWYGEVAIGEPPPVSGPRAP